MRLDDEVLDREISAPASSESAKGDLNRPGPQECLHSPNCVRLCNHTEEYVLVDVALLQNRQVHVLEGGGLKL